MSAVSAVAIEAALATIWSSVLGVKHVRAEDDFFALGGDSLLSIQVVSRAKAGGIPLDYKMIFRNPTLRQLAASVAAERGPQAPATADETPLTPIQERFFATAGQCIEHWNQWVLLEVRSPLQLHDLHSSVEQLFEVHDVLRLRFLRSEHGWLQQYQPCEDRLPIEWVDLTAVPDAQRDEAVELAIREANRSLDPRCGHLMRFVYLSFGAHALHKLLIVAHHLIIDVVSFHLLVNDLDACLHRLSQGQAPLLEANSCTYQSWARLLTDSARTARFEPQLDYWLAQILPIPQALPCDYHAPDAQNTYASLQSCEIVFMEQQTLTIINKLPTLLHCHVNSVLLDALACALHDRFGLEETVIDIESHGRSWNDDGIDLRKATGWYTSVFPQRISSNRDRGVHDRVRALDSQLRAVPDGGLGYGVLRYLSAGNPTERLRQASGAQVCFNYLGQLGRGTQSLFVLDTDRMRTGASHDDDLRRSHLLLFEGAVTGGRLTMRCYYSDRFHRRETVTKLLAAIRHHLEGILPSVARSFRRSFRQLTWDGGASDVDEVLRKVAMFYPLLGMQTSMLFQHLSSRSDAPAYLTQVSCVLRGALSLDTFRYAWQAVVDRHDALRTSFHWNELDAPVQAVHRTIDISFRTRDWRDKDERTQQTELANLLRKDRAAGFALDSPGQLMRIAIVRLADDRHFCVWTHHHLQLDGWSQLVVLREVFQIYQAVIAGEVPSLPAPPSLGSYFRMLDHFPAAEARRYWRRYLQGFREPTRIVTRACRGDGSGESYGEVAICIDPAVSAAAYAFAEANSLTVPTLFRAVWGLWLSIHGATHDVVFGNVVAGRDGDMESLDSLVGTFINTVPVRMVLDVRDSLLQWLRQAQDEQASGHRYELLPLAEVMKLAEVERGRPVFDSILVVENVSASYADIVARTGLELETMDFKIQENYPVVVSVRPERAMTARINYRQDIVDPRIGSAQTFFSVALELLAGAAEQPVSLFRDELARQYRKRLNESGG